jgi:hypothetical protein
VRGPLGAEGPFHLGEQGQEHERDAGHALAGGVDGGTGRRWTDADAPLGEVVDEVEDFAEIAAEPVQGVHDDRVAEMTGQVLPGSYRPGSRQP